MGRFGWLVLSLLLLAAAPAGALSTEQVLELKKAGVSDELIRKIIDHEMRDAGRPGRYVVRQSGGREVIVYRAGPDNGQQDYPLDMDPAWRGAPGLRGMLERTAPDQGAPPAPAREKAKVGGRYTLLLESHRELADAQKRAKELSVAGVECRVESVDLGDQGRWYRVLHGHFTAREQAEAKGDNLRKVAGIGSYTVLAR